MRKSLSCTRDLLLTFPRCRQSSTTSGKSDFRPSVAYRRHTCSQPTETAVRMPSTQGLVLLSTTSVIRQADIDISGALTEPVELVSLSQRYDDRSDACTKPTGSLMENAHVQLDQNQRCGVEGEYHGSISLSVSIRVILRLMYSSLQKHLHQLSTLSSLRPPSFKNIANQTFWLPT
jgi:hypothetical protein